LFALLDRRLERLEDLSDGEECKILNCGTLTSELKELSIPCPAGDLLGKLDKTNNHATKHGGYFW
jgi:hypothetical protein